MKVGLEREAKKHNAVIPADTMAEITFNQQRSNQTNFCLGGKPIIDTKGNQLCRSVPGAVRGLMEISGATVTHIDINGSDSDNGSDRTGAAALATLSKGKGRTPRGKPSRLQRQDQLSMTPDQFCSLVQAQTQVAVQAVVQAQVPSGAITNNYAPGCIVHQAAPPAPMPSEIAQALGDRLRQCHAHEDWDRVMHSAVSFVQVRPC